MPLPEDNSIYNSLDVEDKSIAPFIPSLLHGLPCLGSNPDAACRLIQKHIQAGQVSRALDLGCGKGAVLIELARRFSIRGTGYDIMPEFILEAENAAVRTGTDSFMDFYCQDIRKVLPALTDIDLIIYGHDSELLGDIPQSIQRLTPALSKRGYLLIELCCSKEAPDIGYPLWEETQQAIRESGIKILGETTWTKAEIKKMNTREKKVIRRQVNILSRQYPAFRAAFAKYLQQQEEEWHLLENALICSTWLTKKHKK